MAIFESSLRPRLIYVFAISDEWHRDCLKVGETTLNDDDGAIPPPNSDSLNRAARARIDQYTQTAGIAYNLLYTEMTMYLKGGAICSFNDKQVHGVLKRSGIRKKVFDTVKGANEWYCCDLETVKKAIAAVKSGHSSLSPGEVSQGQSPIVFRPEQQRAIDLTKKQFRKGRHMLWNAKMRFGKTLCALQVARDLEMKRTLILTHRPVVDEGWFEDFGKIFFDRHDYHYGSHTKGEDYETLERLAKKGDKYVYFVSMQDMRGAQKVGGRFEKNEDVFSTEWSLIIVDEAHEGTQTELGQAVLKELIKSETRVLQLSGTPFNLLEDFTEEETYTWDYVMEQKAKSEWDLLHMGDPNPYASLPELNIYTYDLGSLMSQFSDDEKAFNFKEFFRTKEGGSFVYEHDVDNFLDLLCRDDEDSLYPYSNDEYRRIFRHTLWVVPGVAAARALSAKLKAHRTFGAFSIVNVAGDGDEEEENAGALQMVNDAIGPDPDCTFTITLSCGRLTTGVSIKPWTGVFMMSGSYSTSAAGYMQTIFRVQTPYTHNGRMKERCYAFDFAPDRTLRTLAEVAKVSAKAGKTTDGDRKTLGDFLNFCPIISYDGSRMKPYDVDQMMGQLKKAQIEKVVQCGFEDGALYNDELLKLTEVELSDFMGLKGIIGKTKAMANPGDIDINKQGFTAEEYAQKEAIEKKSPKKRTPEEQAELERLKQRHDQRKEAISILRGISIRMPLLIYGADLKDEQTEITIDTFADIIDDTSWAEFMPAGVTKDVFDRFKRYYDPDIFREAGKRIRAMARAADSLPVEQRIERISSIFNTFRNPDKETVLTPWRVVNMHLSDTLGGWCFMDEEFKKPIDSPRFVDRGDVTREVYDPNSVIMEINSKSGLYPLLAAYNIYRRRVELESSKYGRIGDAFSKKLWDMTLEQNILVVCKTPMARSITRRTLIGFRDASVHAEYYPDLIENISKRPNLVVNTLRDGRNFWKLNNQQHMTIDAIIGNPPYQEEGISTRKTPIYHLFYDISFRLSDKVSLITPGRFLFRAGQTPNEWMDKILEDNHFKVVDYFQKSTEVFPTVDIKGGVVITYRDAKADFGKIGFFSEFPELKSILQKVHSHKEFVSNEFSSLVSSQGLYKFTDIAFKEHPELYKVQGAGTAAKITSNAFEHLLEVFKSDKSDNHIGILGRARNQRIYKWIDERYIQPTDGYCESYNVFVPEANGTGAIGEVLSTPVIGVPVIGVPVIGHTDTFLSIGKFTDAQQADRCLKYVKSKFARCMLGTLKATQHNPRETWANVPMQDFTSSSDLDWDTPISEIDRQLYAKYQLSEQEILFIETMIKPME